jgi:hypothetical protein
MMLVILAARNVWAWHEELVNNRIFGRIYALAKIMTRAVAAGGI